MGKIVDRKMVISFMKSLLASLLTGLVASSVCSYGNWVLDGINLEKIVVISAAIAAGVITYIIASFLLRSDEALYVMREVKGRFARRYGNS